MQLTGVVAAGAGLPARVCGARPGSCSSTGQVLAPLLLMVWQALLCVMQDVKPWHALHLKH